MRTSIVRADIIRQLLAASLALAIAFTFGCEEKSSGKAEDNPKPAAEAATEPKAAAEGAELAAKAENPAKTATSQTFTDPRDSKTYKSVKIGEQTWMAQNLDYNAEGSKCYENSESNCQKYGRLRTTGQSL